MLRKIRFLWKQFNGPQISGLMTSIFRYLQTNFNTLIDYFRHFSIQRANNAHLSLIGACMGIVRPIMRFADDTFFFFTATKETGSRHGFSSLNDMSMGAQFSTVQRYYESYNNVTCPEEYYRKVLLAYKDFEGEKYSYLFIQSILESVWQQNHPDRELSTAGIGIRFYQEGDPAPYGVTRTLGDIEIYMGPQTDWGAAEEAALRWQGVFQGIFSTVLSPIVSVDVLLGTLPAA